MTNRLVQLVVLIAAQLGLIAYYWNDLPARVAIHFGRFGRPDAWTSRQGFATFSIVLILSFALTMLAIRWLIARVPRDLINVPRRDFWLHPEREQATRTMLGEWVLGIGVLSSAFTVGVTWLVARANLEEPVRLPNLFFLLLALYLVVTFLAVGFLVLRLLRGTA